MPLSQSGNKVYGTYRLCIPVVDVMTCISVPVQTVLRFRKQTVSFQFCNPKFDTNTIIIGPGHAKTCLMTYANNKGADQPAPLLFAA